MSGEPPRPKLAKRRLGALPRAGLGGALLCSLLVLCLGGWPGDAALAALCGAVAGPVVLLALRALRLLARGVIWGLVHLPLLVLRILRVFGALLFRVLRPHVILGRAVSYGLVGMIIGVGLADSQRSVSQTRLATIGAAAGAALAAVVTVLGGLLDLLPSDASPPQKRFRSGIPRRTRGGNCPYCGGSGVVELYRPMGPRPERAVGYETCIHCGGTGFKGMY